MGIKNTCPVLGFEVGLVVNINLNLNNLSLRLDGVDGNSRGVEKSSEEQSNTSWAPLSNNLSGLEAELGSEYGVLDGSVIIYLTEGKGLVDRGALVSEGVDGSLRVDGNADGKTTGNTRGGGSRGGEVIGGDAWDVFDIGLSGGGVKGGGALLIPRQSHGFFGVRYDATHKAIIHIQHDSLTTATGAGAKAAAPAARVAKMASFIFEIEIRLTIKKDKLLCERLLRKSSFKLQHHSNEGISDYGGR